MAGTRIDPHSYRQGTAKVDLSSKQYCFVKVDEANELEVCGEGQAGYVNVDDPKAGETGTYVIGSEQVKVKCKAAIKIGDLLCSDAEGEAIVAAATSGHIILGVALEAGASGDIIEILTAPPVAKA